MYWPNVYQKLKIEKWSSWTTFLILVMSQYLQYSCTYIWSHMCLDFRSKAGFRQYQFKLVSSSFKMLENDCKRRALMSIVAHSKSTKVQHFLAFLRAEIKNWQVLKASFSQFPEPFSFRMLENDCKKRALMSIVADLRSTKIQHFFTFLQYSDHWPIWYQ